MTTNSALSASLRSLRLRRLLAGAGVLAFAAVAFTGSPAWGEPREKIVLANSCLVPVECSAAEALLIKGELYIINPDGSKPIRLTNDSFSDALPALSPDGKGKIVFDSNRIAGFRLDILRFDSDLFLINADGTADGGLQPRPLTQGQLGGGSSASFDPTGKNIVFHRSASPPPEQPYGTRIKNFNLIGFRNEPGGPTTDSDIFLVNLDDLLDLETPELPVNLTNGLTSTPGVRGPYASDDADWSPDGKWIAFTSRIPNVEFDQADAGIYVMNLETKLVTKLTNLTNSGPEERSPAWSPDGTHIAIMRRRNVAPTTFEIWVLGFDPASDPPRVTTEIQLTDNTTADLSPAWSPRGEKIVFHANRPGPGNSQIFVIDANGQKCKPGDCSETALTGPSAPTGAVQGQNLFPKWGLIAVGRDPQ